MRIEFSVHGTPQPQGSARAFMPKGWSRPVITSDNAKLKPWRQEVAGMARQAMQGEPLESAVYVECEFSFPRPKSLSKKVRYKTTKPDADKLLRAALDSMTGIVFRDDAQVVSCRVTKGFAEEPGARFAVGTLDA